MNWDPYNDASLKRPYPFEYEETQFPLEQPMTVAESLQYNNPMPVDSSLQYNSPIPVDSSLQYNSPTPVDSSFQSDEPALCLLGAVTNVNAQLRKNSGLFFSCPSSLTEVGPSIAIDVSLVGDYFELLAEGNAFARLDKSFCREARRVVDLGAEFKACLECKEWEDFKSSWAPYQTSSYSATFTVDVNVYSARHHADKIGTLLMHSGIFLQRPAHDVGDNEYHNPQILELHGVSERPEEMLCEPDETPTHIVVPNLQTSVDAAQPTQDSDHVDLILNSLSHVGMLHEIRTDTNRIKSELMPHQMTALDFIEHRESGKPPTELSFWRKKNMRGEKHFQHILTKSKSADCHESRGGIIADDMGLGKSLTILSVIAKSLPDASEFISNWEPEADEQSQVTLSSRATLVVVPSTILIDNWIDEIRTHTYPNGITFHKHIGTDRKSELQSLLEKDIVFTTFATAMKDDKRGQSSIFNIHWFRIVLDEAHKIRNRTTQQFKTVQKLSGQRRWCLTGTPIQNKLEDLGSIVAFLRVPDLERVSTFRTCIIAPTSPDRGRRFNNLQILLKTICIRRTREILGLPEPIADSRLLAFSSVERQEYDNLYELYRKRVQMAVSGASKVASTTLQSIHELRLFCNNGPRKTQHGQHGSDDEILSYLQQLEQNMCAKCSLSIYCIDQVGEKNGGVFIWPCKHLVCHSCHPQCLKKKTCMLCESGNAPPDLTNHIGTEAPNVVVEETPVQYPSKLVALLQDIKMEPSHKCIVFSSWKKTLDLAGELLKGAGLKHDIIHGSLSLKQRLRVLKDFKSILGPNILLMTLGTGAEGLNLTIASRIYLLEPQWNPFLELQAMARAQRIGQTKQVVCVRYVMQRTIEQSDVLNRQKRKTALAGGGFKNQKMQESLEYFRVGAASTPGQGSVS